MCINICVSLIWLSRLSTPVFNSTLAEICRKILSSSCDLLWWRLEVKLHRFSSYTCSIYSSDSKRMATSGDPAGRNWRVLLIALMFMCVAPRHVSAQSESNVYVTAQDYTSEHDAGSIAGLYCDQYDNHNPYPVCETNYWVAYSVSLSPPMSESLCGQCLQITNNDGGATIKACILDQKVAAGLDLDLPGFSALDTDGSGYQSGHLYTSINFVSC